MICLVTDIQEVIDEEGEGAVLFYKEGEKVKRTVQVVIVGCALLMALFGRNSVVHAAAFRSENIPGAPAVTSPEQPKATLAQASVIPRLGPWLGVDGRPLRFENNQQVIEFLRTARVVSQERVGLGVNGIAKVLLKRDGVQMHAAFRDVRVEETRELPSGTQVEFRDNCIFECAAYELSRLLGLNNVPPVVEREIGGVKGTLQMWIEGTITEEERKKKNLPLQDELHLNRQWEVMRIFDNLIYNEDRNSNNILYDRNGKLWMIDHTRSFTKYAELPYPSAIQSCERTLWEKLQGLDPAVAKMRLEKYLRASQIDALIERKRELVGHIQEMIAEKGEDFVLFTWEF